MEVTARNMTSDIFRRSTADTISGNVSPGKMEFLSPVQDRDSIDDSQDKPVNREELAKAIADINKTLALHSTRLEFSIHDKTKAIMVKVIDEKTGELIREVPPKRVLDMVAMAWDEMGLLVDEKA